jgi:hypothetical protein
MNSFFEKLSSFSKRPSRFSEGLGYPGGPASLFKTPLS